MTSIHSSLLALVLTPVLLGCGEDAPAPGPAPTDHRLVAALRDPDAAVRRHAAEGLGEAPYTTLEMIYALMAAQHDGDASVSRAALAALDRIHPPPEIALRVYGGDCYEEVVDDLIVRPAYVTWRKVACEVDPLSDDETLGACWMLVEVPPVYETRIKHALVHPDRGFWRDARDVRADDAEAVRARPPPPPLLVPAREVPPEGEPVGAEPGEVWCRHEAGTSAGGTWRRHPECEVPTAPR